MVCPQRAFVFFFKKNLDGGIQPVYFLPTTKPLGIKNARISKRHGQPKFSERSMRPVCKCACPYRPSHASSYHDDVFLYALGGLA